MFHKNGVLKEIGRRYDEEDTYLVLFFSQKKLRYTQKIIFRFNSVVSKNKINKNIILVKF